MKTSCPDKKSKYKHQKLQRTTNDTHKSHSQKMQEQASSSLKVYLDRADTLNDFARVNGVQFELTPFKSRCGMITPYSKLNFSFTFYEKFLTRDNLHRKCQILKNS